MIRILVGDALTRLRELPDNSVHCCVTSPPFYGLRDYGTATWEGGNAECDHVSERKAPTVDSSSRLGYPANGGPRRIGQDNTYHEAYTVQYRSFCAQCGAQRIDQQIGLEDTPEAYIARLVEVFHEVRRVLHPSGVIWVNMGDSYSSGGGAQVVQTKNASHGLDGMRQRTPWIGPKQLLGIPWKLAFALQDDGWWLRSDIVWSKPNAMPESVTDRCSKSHEYIFMLTKSANYFYDQDAIREPHKPESLERYEYGLQSSAPEDGFIANGATTGIFKSERMGDHVNPAGRNKRSVWTIATQPYSESHFATFPPDLVYPMIKAGSSQYGCCPKCLAPYQRVIEKTGKSLAVEERRGRTGHNGQPPQISGNYWTGPTTAATDEWQPTCKCNAGDPRPCVVLDCFAGSGTTLMVADRLGRDAIGVELSPTYARMAEKRIREDAGMFAEIEVIP